MNFEVKIYKVLKSQRFYINLSLEHFSFFFIFVFERLVAESEL